jgi:DNA-binding MarR family transcriptional regulator
VADEIEWYEDISIPALLRAARSVYGAAIRRALGEAGCDDLPANGPYVIGAMARGDVQLAEIISQVGRSKQAAGQLVDTLVMRGYLDRQVDVDDRRRLVVSLTPRGELAAEVIRSAISHVDSRLTSKVGADKLAQTRETLGALITLVADA